jgi:hypothetical protein
VRFSGRLTEAVAGYKPEAESWGAWITYLTENYRRSNFRSPACHPSSRRLLAWAALSLDEIGRAVTGHALAAGPDRVSELRRITAAAHVQVQVSAIRVALESWRHPSPVTSDGEGSA